jgi:hypothetical protein
VIVDDRSFHIYFFQHRPLEDRFKLHLFEPRHGQRCLLLLNRIHRIRTSILSSLKLALRVQQERVVYAFPIDGCAICISLVLPRVCLSHHYVPKVISFLTYYVIVTSLHAYVVVHVSLRSSNQRKHGQQPPRQEQHRNQQRPSMAPLNVRSVLTDTSTILSTAMSIIIASPGWITSNTVRINWPGTIRRKCVTGK